MSTMRNSVMLIGRPDKDVLEAPVAFNLIVTEKIRDRETNGYKNFSQSFRCVCENETTASKMVGRVQKGKQIALDGSLRVDKEAHCEILINDFFLIDKPDK